MKIFVAYGYNARDKWIEDMVFPIIRSFDSEVVTGEGAYEGQIPNIVCDRIARSDALIAFTTKRMTSESGSGETHRWVLEELALGFNNNPRVVEVREQGVSQPGGITQGLQRIEYDEGQRDKCLVEIVRALGSWHQSVQVRIQLLPPDLAKSLQPYLYKDGLTCKYVVKRGNHEDEPVSAHITEMSAGLFIEPSVPRDGLIRINVTFGEKVWASVFEPIDSYGINLKPQQPESWWRRKLGLGS